MQTKPIHDSERKASNESKDSDALQLFVPPSESTVDVHVQCTDNLLRCHSTFLMVHSKVFSKALQSSKRSPHTLLVDFPAKDFSTFLRAVYSVNIPGANFSNSEMFTIYEISPIRLHCHQRSVCQRIHSQGKEGPVTIQR